MNSIFKKSATTLLLAASISGAANAAEVMVASNITTSTTWTANNTYNLQQQVFVKPGATLTIEAGTVVASTTNLGGSLAVSRGGQIFVNGTVTNPVIMTSKADVATWVAGDPTTGTWREGANEWGNLTLMGDAYISENASVGNTPAPSASNIAAMEGLVAAFPGDTSVEYGGGNDDDDSGSIRYLSLRYGGRVIGLGNELNGLSLGGIGRGTDIDHVEIMNNVDDGIEIFGGAVNLKYVSIWNVGDDSFDIDQGWRGKAQFAFIVQGYSLDAKQGSGVGDNCFETDGAEDSDWQPVTTATIYNATVVGQPVHGDQGTAWRDNARVQYRNCVFMDLGDQLVKFDNVDGDGANGYGHNGTLDWPTTWTTDYTVTSLVNPPVLPMTPADLYKSQTSGKLAEMTNSVFFRNQGASAYTEATARGVLDVGSNNVLIPGFLDTDAPIKNLVRGPAVVKGGKTMLPVVSIDPRPANEALLSVAAAPADGFFTPVNYRGAFDPNFNWLCGWSAADAFGLLQSAATVTVRSDAANVPSSLNTNGLPTLGNAGFAFVADNPTGTCGVNAGSVAIVLLTTNGAANLPLPGFGCGGGLGTLLISPTTFMSLVGIYAGTPVNIAAPMPVDGTFCGLPVQSQVAFVTPAGPIVLGDAVDLVLGN